MISNKLSDFSKHISIISSVQYANLAQKYGCLTTEAQINFLCNLIQNYKINGKKDIKNVVEIGTNLGFTANFMLKEGIRKYGKDFKLTSYDLDSSEKIGCVVFENSTKEEKEAFSLCKGMTFSDYCVKEKNKFEQNKIDLAFVDGQHTHPGPLIDVLFLLPFMKKGGLIVFHDINFRYDPDDWGACYVYDGLDVEKTSLQGDIIGCIVVPDDISSLHNNLLHIAKQPFNACIWVPDKSKCLAEREIPLLEDFLFRYYDKDFSEELLAIIKNNIAKYDELNLDLAKRAESMRFMYFKILELENRINCLTKDLEKSRFETLHSKCAGKNVLLYGAGLNAKRLFSKFDFSKLNIVGISDIKFETDKGAENFGYKAIPPSCIKNVNYDCIVLMVEQKSYITDYLTNTLDVSRDKIIEF
ncbi:class I SAM-dependent methyltransferase [bacterium]|nr:class I SAM-dependent methyltransferase [bacterium]